MIKFGKSGKGSDKANEGVGQGLFRNEQTFKDDKSQSTFNIHEEPDLSRVSGES